MSKLLKTTPKAETWTLISVVRQLRQIIVYIEVAVYHPESRLALGLIYSDRWLIIIWDAIKKMPCHKFYIIYL